MADHRKGSDLLAVGAVALGAVVLGSGLMAPAQAQPATTTSTAIPPVTAPPWVKTGEPPFDFVQFPTPPSAVLTVEPTTVTAGSAVTVSGNLCGQGAVVQIGNPPDGPFVTATLNHLEPPDWRVEVTIPPAFPPGTHEVHTGCRLAYGADVGFLYETTTLRVIAPAVPPPPSPVAPPPVAPAPVAVPVQPRLTG